jgi:hypothetical protein
LKLPDTVNILGTYFNVFQRPLNDDMCGESNPSERYIQINETLAAEVKAEVFYHELVHTLLAHGGLDAMLTEQENELFAQYLGMALYYLLTANPNLPRGGQE